MTRQEHLHTHRRYGARYTLPALLVLPVLALACTEEDQIATVTLPLTVANSHVGHTGTNGKSYATDMTQELTTTVSGDPDGVGTALLTLNAGQQIVCWSTTAANIDRAIASHIHEAPPGLSGPIRLPLTPPDEATGRASGCAEDVDRALIVDILRNPASYYVNVHTTEHVMGAIRGQLAH